MQEDEVYAAIGEEGFNRLIRTFYSQVPQDEVLGAMYPPDDLQAAEQRLKDFLIFRFGGPQRYIEERGHPRLRMRHAPFAVGDEARQHWLQLMSRALDQADFPDEVRRLLWTYFESTAAAMMNRP
ncbi:MAG: globin [Acidobacteriaceae bacterium]|nr:globin [Acidobacteriaceae bacterium]